MSSHLSLRFMSAAAKRPMCRDGAMTGLESTQPGDVPNARTLATIRRGLRRAHVSEATQVSPQGKGTSSRQTSTARTGRGDGRLVTAAVHAAGGPNIAQRGTSPVSLRMSISRWRPTGRAIGGLWSLKGQDLDSATRRREREELVDAHAPSLDREEIRGVIAGLQTAARNAIVAGLTALRSTRQRLASINAAHYFERSDRRIWRLAGKPFGCS